MEITKTGISDLLIITPKVFEDSRGYFFESYNSDAFEHAGVDHIWVQDNQSKSEYGVIRGLHYQLAPFSQSKLVRVISGNILDVAVDIRKGSPTFGQHFSVELSDKNRKQLLVPKGFAHGFSVLSDHAIVLYKCDTLYNHQAERGIMYNDPKLAIDWQIPLDKTLVSAKDKVHPTFMNAELNFVFS
ncbi:dTDP-4-dehydrorhamnose 3,5-epimerase [Williamwhitmania taraxaci]|uniref:dTDP-4-dehydrorhamnose 3,5-epimerase n=1 Tax=Williamwhitmania taraxaci TaxID=1640674 RepID=A0A1G6H5V4_9BACT|nr:dTDP-4-dehydrorhamnose 3,5-epimerase [Williamwhitmania taraxaci]SDB89660.1 dTDP-4-dehydrorhamnose 3,5-epimerase [Williamwhitmania taraxaci]